MPEERNHVVFVSQMFPPEKGGNASRIHDTAVNLRNLGWQVSVLSPPPSHPPGEFQRSWNRATTESINGVTVHRLWTYQPQCENPGMVRRVLYYLIFGVHCLFWLLWHVRDYDAVVTSTPPISTGEAGLLASVLGKPWIVDVRDLWIDAAVELGYLQQGSRIERASRRFQRLVLHTADRITVTTEKTGKSLAETYGDRLEDKTVVIPNGVDTTYFSPAETPKRGAAAVDTSETSPRLYPSADGHLVENTVVSCSETSSQIPVIIYTGNLGSAQDLESFVRAMKHVSNDDAILRLVGGGDRKSELQELARSLDVSDRVEFVEPVPRVDVPRLLNTATLGIAPLSDSEELEYAVPTKVYEYMACDLPVVVTGNGELEQFMSESGGGIVVENDAHRISSRLDDLLDDEDTRRQLGARGRQHVVDNYERETIACRLSEELSRLVAGPGSE